MTDPERFGLYTATFKPRTTGKFEGLLRPGLAELDETPVLVSYGWEIDEHDHSLYIGEWAMIFRGESKSKFPIGWTASGDLEGLKKVSEDRVDD